MSKYKRLFTFDEYMDYEPGSEPAEPMIITNYKFVYTDDEDESGSNYQFLIDFDKEEVVTNCGDYYYDYSISFDNIIKLADYIKSIGKKWKKIN